MEIKCANVVRISGCTSPLPSPVPEAAAFLNGFGTMAAPAQTLQVIHVQRTTALFDRLYMVDYGSGRVFTLPRTFFTQGVTA